MSYATVGAITLAAALAVAGCSESVDGGGSTASPSDIAPVTTLTVSGTPERVTDVAALALTDEQAAEIEEACEEDGGVPGGNRGCSDLIEKLKERCRKPSFTLCLLTAPILDKPGQAVLQLRDQREGSPACSKQKLRLCKGIVVSSDVVTSLTATPSDTPTSSHTPPPTTSSTPDVTTSSVDPSNTDSASPDSVAPTTP